MDETSLLVSIEQFLVLAVNYVWSTPLVVALVGAGLFFTIALGIPQFKGFIHAIKVVMGRYDDKDDPGQISHFQALCTALSATVGLGNIAGVAVAIHGGGPGAVFWMIVVGFVGMATKYSEVTLALMYREKGTGRIVRGGPMYYIKNGLGPKFKPLAVFFSVACICGSFGAANMFQSNQVATILESNFHINPWITGITLAVLTAIVIIGGIESIGRVTSKLVPIMGGLYVIGCFVVIFTNLSEIPYYLYRIVNDAFNGTAAVGAFSGIVVREVIKQGVQRASFSNEAGLGSSPLAHSAATTKEPVREGVVALLEPFVDTILICTMTALVILLSGAWKNQEANGVLLTAIAFDDSLHGFGKFFVPIAVSLFAYSTLLSWSYYGEIASNFLFGGKSVVVYKTVFCCLIVLGAVRELGPVLAFSDIMLGLMVVPNLTAVILLFPKLRAETKKYFSRLKKGEFDA